jgi:hypothetical protein
VDIDLQYDVRVESTDADSTPFAPVAGTSASTEVLAGVTLSHVTPSSIHQTFAYVRYARSTCTSTCCLNMVPVLEYSEYWSTRSTGVAYIEVSTVSKIDFHEISSYV